MTIQEISPVKLADLLQSSDNLVLLDVREDDELQVCHLDFTHHIPLGELEERLDELDKDDKIVVYCKMGGRSARAAQTLLDHGFSDVTNLTGGIIGWAKEVDPALPTY
jgi:adenylyltransferase/sulfurtransferase